MDQLLCVKVDGFHQLKCVFTLLSAEEREKINKQLPDDQQISPCIDCDWDKLFGTDFEHQCHGLNDTTHTVKWQEYEICRVAGDKQVIHYVVVLLCDASAAGGQEGID